MSSSGTTFGRLKSLVQGSTISPFYPLSPDLAAQITLDGDCGVKCVGRPAVSQFRAEITQARDASMPKLPPCFNGHAHIVRAPCRAWKQNVTVYMRLELQVSCPKMLRHVIRYSSVFHLHISRDLLCYTRLTSDELRRI